MEKKLQKQLSHRSQFVDRAIFMASSLPNLANNLAEWVHKTKCKYGQNYKKIEVCGIK